MTLLKLLPLSLLLLCGCRPGHPSQERPELPDVENSNMELLNRATRFTSADFSLNYEDGGVIVTSSPELITMTDLTTGHEVTFTALDFEEGELTWPKLTLDGKAVNVKRGKCLRKNETGVWFELHTPAETVYLVVTDL